MPDTRTVAHEIQEQLVAAMHRGHKQLRKSQEQFRKGQEQLRKSQEQLRKGREAVNVAIRSGNELAKAVRPNIPALPGKGLQLPPLSTLRSPAKLRAHAQDFAGQVAATQRSLADKALHVAGPLVVDGVARLNQAAKSFLEQRDQEHPEPLAPRAVKTTAESDAVNLETKNEREPGAADAKPAARKVAAAKPATAKTGTAKTGAAKTGAAKTSTVKTSTAKTAAAKTGTARTSTAKTGTAKAKN
jgi:exonuclease VII small subunit